MDQITLRIPKETLEEIEEEANEHGTSRSEYIRDILESHENTNELQKEHKRDIDELQSEQEREIKEYENEIQYLQNQIDRLQRTNLKILEQREENTDLQVYVDEHREWEQASWFTRQKWKLFGKD